VTLRLPDRWLWDFWFARDGADVHVFYLQAPRALGDPELRHVNATIGHAVSRDLRDWRILPDALGPGAPGAFDDLATWTGSIVQHGGRWMLLYTGVSRAEGAGAQRIGLASSADLLRWELVDTGGGTRLTLRHTVAAEGIVPKVAAGWHLCFDVAEHLLAGDPVPTVRGQAAMEYGWQDLHDRYAAKLGIEATADE